MKKISDLLSAMNVQRKWQHIDLDDFLNVIREFIFSTHQCYRTVLGLAAWRTNGQYPWCGPFDACI